MNRSPGFILVLLIGLTSCIPSSNKQELTEWKTIDSENFTLAIPSHLKEADNLHEDAVIQYQNLVKEFYCIVIQESAPIYHDMITKAELENDYPLTLDGYAKFVADRLKENVTEMLKETEMKPIKVKKANEATYFEVEAKVDNVDIYYHYGFVKGDTSYYQVLSWTLLSKEPKYKDTMLGILQSFNEK